MKRKSSAEINRDRRRFLCYSARISLVILAAIFLRPLRIQSPLRRREHLCPRRVSENCVDCNTRNKESCVALSRKSLSEAFNRDLKRGASRAYTYLSRNVTYTRDF